MMRKERDIGSSADDCTGANSAYHLHEVREANQVIKRLPDYVKRTANMTGMTREREVD